MGLLDYFNWYKHQSLWWKITNFLRWRLSYLKAFLFGSPCLGERLLLRTYGDTDFFQKPKKLYCSWCGWDGTSDSVGQLYPYIQDVIEQLKPGEEVPAGICPNCNNILYLKRKQYKKER